MTRTISIITATVGAALLFALPAYGDSWGADKAQPLAQPDPMVEDGFAQAVAAAEQIRIERMLDARERGLGVTNTVVDARSEGMNRLYGLGEYANPIDLRERGLVEKSQAQTKVEQPAAGFDARSDGLNRIYGLGEYAPSVVAAISSGRRSESASGSGWCSCWDSASPSRRRTRGPSRTDLGRRLDPVANETASQEAVSLCADNVEAGWERAGRIGRARGAAR